MFLLKSGSANAGPCHHGLRQSLALLSTTAIDSILHGTAMLSSNV